LAPALQRDGYAFLRRALPRRDRLDLDGAELVMHAFRIDRGTRAVERLEAAGDEACRGNDERKPCHKPCQPARRGAGFMPPH
jgi:hypothetical protein